jgi:hypothetical protein
MDQASLNYREADYRAIYRDGSLTLVPYMGWFAKAYGFAGQVFREAADVVVADFEIYRGREGLELIVSTLNEPIDGSFETAVISFARGLSYKRVWMPGEVIEVDRDGVLPPTEVETTCQACGTTFRERQVTFILNARQQGAWPCACPLDGQPLPQWSSTQALPEEAHHG